MRQPLHNTHADVKQTASMARHRVHRGKRMRGARRRVGLAAAASIVAALAVCVHGQDQFALYLLVLDKAGIPVLDIDPSDIRIEEDAGPATVLGVSRFGWPLKLTVLVDNGPGTADALVHLRNGLNALVGGIPRSIPVSIVTTAPNPRWLIRDSKDLVQIKNAVGRLTPDEGLGRFSDALGEFAQRLDQESRRVEDGLPPYLPVLVSIATTHADGSDVRRERNEKMLLSLRMHRVWTNMVMVSPGRRPNEPGEVSNIDVDEGQNGEIALLVQKVTGGNYVAVSSGGTTALASSILPAVAQKISLRYLKQMTQHRIVFVRTPGATGPMQNLRVAFANHPGAHVIVSTDGNLP